MSSNLARTFIKKFLFNNTTNTKIQHQTKRLESYKAALLKETDAPIEINELKTTKKLTDYQVRIKVHYCSLNTNDVAHFKSGSVKNFIPGYEFSGEVLEIGSKVTPDITTIGERVAVLSKNRGGLAGQCVVDSNDVFRLPSNVKRKDAAVLVFGHTNALYAFSKLSTVKEDTKIIIATGPAGIGLAAIDVAANIYNAKPTGICMSEELSAVVRDRGAFKTATFQTKNLVKDFGGADIIYDAVGGESHKLINGCIKPEGLIFYASPINSSIPTPPLNSWLSVVNIEGLRNTDFELYRTLVSDTLDMADEGHISAYISAEFNLDNINEALKYIEANKCTGKVLIKVTDD